MFIEKTILLRSVSVVAIAVDVALPFPSRVFSFVSLFSVASNSFPTLLNIKRTRFLLFFRIAVFLYSFLFSFFSFSLSRGHICVSAISDFALSPAKTLCCSSTSGSIILPNAFRLAERSSNENCIIMLIWSVCVFELECVGLYPCVPHFTSFSHFLRVSFSSFPNKAYFIPSPLLWGSCLRLRLNPGFRRFFLGCPNFAGIPRVFFPFYFSLSLSLFFFHFVTRFGNDFVLLERFEAKSTKEANDNLRFSWRQLLDAYLLVRLFLFFFC